MNRIRIRSFGPIRDSGWVEIKKVTVFLGNQGSGKSTVAKLISSFLWMEKVLFRGDYPAKWFERKGRFRSQMLAYHRLEHYIRKNGSGDSSISYEGDFYDISYTKGALQLKLSSPPGQLPLPTGRHTDPYLLPQILYVPAERNFIAYVRTPKELKLSSEALKTFIGEFSAAKEGMKGELALPINNSSLEYDRLNDNLNLRGKDYRIRLSDAASGFQSFIPLYLVSQHVASSMRREGGTADSEMNSEELRRFQKGVEELYSNKELSDEQRKAAISVLSRRFKKSAFINIVEEPEQNLFPTSQSHLLFSLLGFNNERAGNKLIFTTHSPYLVNALSLAVKGAEVNRMIKQRPPDGVGAKTATTAKGLSDRLRAIVPLDALTDVHDVAVYQLDEQKGTAELLPMPHGIPSDDNYLNMRLGASNDAFGRLLDIEEDVG